MKWFLLTRGVAVAAVVLGLGAAPAAMGGAAWSWNWRPGGVAVGVHLDLVSVLLLVFVGLLGWVVSNYCVANLRGRGELERTGSALFVALASLLVMVSGSSLVSVALGWTVSGLAVAALVARSGTPQARRAAALMRRTLLVGDLFLWSGVLVALLTLPSLERTRLQEVDPGWATTVVTALMLGACVARTGLVPAHRWLAETAEAPSPVSAFLHAGVVNAAGVLVLLCWPLFRAAPAVLAGLVVLGAASVLCGVWAGRVRGDIKGRLACSTTSQMGYMCIQLGLGLPAAALLHLMGHGAYKSWLFLRAGGTVARTRAAVAPHPDSSWAGRRAAALAGAVAILIGLPAASQLTIASGITVMVPVALAVLTAASAGFAVAGLRRVSGSAVTLMAVGAGVLAGSYTWVLLGWERFLSVALVAAPVWGPVPGSVLLVVVTATAVLAIFGHRHLRAHPDSGFAVRLLPTALPPMRPPRGHRGLRLPDPGQVTPQTSISTTTATSAVVAAATVVGPAWPLRNLVAANTLAHLEFMSFDDALLVARRSFGVTGRPSLSYFLDLFESGRITADHIQAALQQVRAERGDAPAAVADVLAAARAMTGVPGVGAAQSDGRHLAVQGRNPLVHRRCEALPQEQAKYVTALVDSHAALWAQRAWSTTAPMFAGEPDSALASAGPWYRWRAAASHPSYDRASRIRGAAAAVRTLPQDPAAAVGALANLAGISADRLVGYLVATLASAPGWAGHAAWRARRLADSGPLVELAALRMAHDILYTCAAAEDAMTRTALESPWWRHIPKHDSGVEEGPMTVQISIWQRALEIGIENWLLPELTGQAATPTASPLIGNDHSPHRPVSQSLWCIDVRSERVRRNLEQLGDHHSYGYAGFFGAAVRRLDADGIAHENFPALIDPSFTACEQPTPLQARQVIHRTITTISQTPLASLMIAEGGGMLAALASTAATLAPGQLRGLNTAWIVGRASRPGRSARTPSPAELRQRPQVTTDLDLAGRVELAAAALRMTGLTGNYAPVILICGHGSTTENNAYATSYDCGACGGNHGLLNAVLLAEALNDPAVRSELAAKGLHLPPDTVAVPALHDTTTDKITMLLGGDLPIDSLPERINQSLLTLEVDLRTAGHRTTEERRRLLPSHQGKPETRPLTARAADWSEPTPEWGLSGNAAIVIGPRQLTRAMDLRGRVFLHSYNRDGDSDGTILEQLLTAPLVVAQWINAQYYFSAVEPDTFGAGDKTTHNVIGDVGVITGAHGDLRSGLPWQALFRHAPGLKPDALSLVHEPVRLLAIVAADPARILDIVTRHPQLGQLVANQWINLICLDRGHPRRLHSDLTWRPWPGVPITRTNGYRTHPRPGVLSKDPR